ncbi:MULTISPECIES: hypothetical protein [Bacillus amyloliquefaciens group]|uniref:hypothetical protein n=1 Tax=Bacillus amyloliquefaciens group TaxID=1938374 RepID=UPI0002059486|nr:MULTISPECIES: hypothetical protein [Bacillus amyloliquefaciens group]AIW35064.1 hypothetical protein KS08_16005 [Bacillus subtilis]AEB25406.1 hypothetical protein BAMTA208_16270 [Bacillus amyloliquefaciens TA208]MEC1831320.1 hypothetical protein [Bacillus amyloliquefaciens]MEC1834982.1 hypothetical protein [Bacillus amyloliquefaciens]MEC1842174.1 hypothetical protein [Bacillus amyloliquefaciens]
MENIKCAACGFEEGEASFVTIAPDKNYVFLVKSRGLNSATQDRDTAKLVMCPDCKTVRIR